MPPDPQCRDNGPETSAPALGAGRRAAWLITAAVLVGLPVLLALDRSALAASLEALRHLRGGWLIAGAGAEVLSIVCAALGGRRLLRAGGGRIRLYSILAVATAGGALASSVPFAGTQVAAAYAFRQYRRRDVSVAVAWWAMVVSWMLANLSFAVLLAAGAATSGNLAASLAGVTTALAFLMPPAAVLLALRYPAARALMHRIAVCGTAACRRVLRRPRTDPAALIETTLNRMAGLRLPLRQYGEVLAWYLCNWLGDVTCLVCAIRAVGVPVPWHGLLLVYAAGVTAASLGLTPGGIGLVEAAMSAALVAAGMRAGQALSVVLVYRFLSFWLLLAAGWVVMGLLARYRPAPGDREAPADSPVPARSGP